MDDLDAKIAIWRQKAIDGKLTQEEMREAIALKRADRRAALTASDNSRRAKAKAVVPSAQQLLDELDGL